jgi:hypothetical protein
VQGGDVPVPDGFLSPGVGGYFFYGQINLDEAFGVGVHNYDRVFLYTESLRKMAWRFGVSARKLGRVYLVKVT